jgi:PilZ domain
MSSPSSGAAPESASGRERRAWVRYHSKPETPLFAIGEQEVIHSWKAKVRDVSLGGISLNVTTPFDIGSSVDVELSIPGVDATRMLVARVVRCESQEGPVWLVACAFEQPLTQAEVDKIAAEGGPVA